MVSVVADGSVKVETFQVAVKVFAVMLELFWHRGESESLTEVDLREKGKRSFEDRHSGQVF